VNFITTLYLIFQKVDTVVVFLLVERNQLDCKALQLRLQVINQNKAIGIIYDFDGLRPLFYQDN
jgi:hypothetical protein